VTVLAEVARRVAARYGLRTASGTPRRLEEAVAAYGRSVGVPPREAARRALGDPTGLRLVAERLTVEETYFFRQPQQLTELVDYLQGCLEGGLGAATVWSAGCSTGDEPHGLAILLQERLPPRLSSRVRIVATDINRPAIERARSGLYSAWSLRTVDRPMAERYFAPDEGGFRLRDDVRRRVTFTCLSLQEHLEVLPARSVDAILFRNVGIYLESAALEELYRGFARVLGERGLLLVSATDPKPPAPPFRLTRDGDPTLFCLTSPAEAASPGCGRAEEMRAADMGGALEAEPVVGSDAARDPDSRAARLHRAQLCLARLDAAGAADELRRLLFLDPTDDAARYWYALALREAGLVRKALRQAESLVSRCQAGGGEADLARAASSLVKALQ
jgi:chemotaxis protein methyltransferase CheR